MKFFAERCRQGRELVNERLGRMKRVHNIPNQGSFYAMFSVDGVDDTLAFCKRAVVEAKISPLHWQVCSITARTLAVRSSKLPRQAI